MTTASSFDLPSFMCNIIAHDLLPLALVVFLSFCTGAVSGTWSASILAFFCFLFSLIASYFGFHVLFENILIGTKSIFVGVPAHFCVSFFFFLLSLIILISLTTCLMLKGDYQLANF